MAAVTPTEAAAWPPEALAVVRRLAQDVSELRAETDQLQRALESRIVIEQAKGMLAERLSVTPENAFDVLRRSARSAQVRLHDLAREVLALPETPPAVARELARHGAERG